MSKIREAEWATTPPDCDGQQTHWAVGKPIWANGGPGPVITRITVQEDLPGLHCHMRRVCVWIGDDLAAEAPVHSLEAIGYAIATPEAPHDRA